MTKDKKERKRLAFRYSLAAVLSLVLISIAFPLYNGISRRAAIDRELDGLGSEIARLESKNNELKGLLRYLGSDEFVEERARLDLNLRKEGEEVFVVSEAEGPQPAAPSAVPYDIRGLERGSADGPGNPRRWAAYFFGI